MCNATYNAYRESLKVNMDWIYTFYQPRVFLLRRLHLKDHKGGHYQSKGETSPATTVVLLVKLAHELVDLLSVNPSILKKFPKLRGVLEGLDKLVDVRIVFEVVGEVGHCLAVGVQLAQYVGQVDVLAFLDPQE